MKKLKLILLIVITFAIIESSIQNNRIFAKNEDKKEAKPLKYRGKEAITKFMDCLNNSKKVSDKLFLPADTYKLNSVITIDKAGFLEFAPGTKVLFGNNAGIICFGQINAIGTKEKRITFTANEDSKWANITFSGEKSKGSKLEYCTISKGTGFDQKVNRTDEIARLGGGILVKQKSSLELNSCIIEKNVADFGGGINVSDATLFMSGCTVRENKIGDASDDTLKKELKKIGGGLYCKYSSIKINSCNFSQNIAGYSAYCAGIWAYNSRIKITNTKTKNSSLATTYGNDIYMIFKGDVKANFEVKNIAVTQGLQNTFILETENHVVRKLKSNECNFQNLISEFEKLQTQPQVQTKQNIDGKILKESENKFLELVKNNKPIDIRLILPAKTYEINKNVVIAEGGELKLLPGTKFLFSNLVGIFCQGTLNAEGTREKPIEFTSGEGKEWSNMYFKGKKSAKSKLIHCNVSECTGIPKSKIIDGSGWGHDKKVGSIICKDNANITLLHSSIKNSKTFEHSGFYLIRSIPTINKCVIQSNHAENDSAFSIFDCKDIVVKDCIITGNKSEYGGNIFVTNSIVTFDNCIICKNELGSESKKSHYAGITWTSGCILCYNSKLSLIKSKIISNVSKYSCPASGLSIVKSHNSSIHINNCTIANNSCLEKYKTSFIDVSFFKKMKYEISIENSILDDNNQRNNSFFIFIR